jgi:hydrophobe/amphiphile efflux-3 (HAE3) family protein
MLWKRLGGLIVRRPVAVLAVAAVVIAGLGSGLARLQFRTDQDTLVDAHSKVYVDNVRFQNSFGGESMLVLFTGDVVDLFSPANLASLDKVEAELRTTPGVAAVISPASSLRFGIDQLSVAGPLLGKAAERSGDPAAYGAKLGADAQRFVAAGTPSLSNPAFVRFLVYGADGKVRSAQATTFPDGNHALMVAQLSGNLSIDKQAEAARAIKQVVTSQEFTGHQVLVTGSPALLDEINHSLKGGMTSLGAIALAAMLVILWVAFRVRWRLLPLAVMAGGTASALGGAVLLGIHLSLVTIAGLPIFIGLGVDFAIQMHNRYAEQRAEGDSVEDAATTAMTAMAGPLTVAMVAGGFGFVALRLSAVPMIQDFGLLLCLGVVLLVAAAIVLPLTILVLADRNRPPLLVAPEVTVGAIERAVGRLAGLGRNVVIAILGVGVVVGAAGFAVEGSMPIDTDVEHWVAPNTKSLGDLDQVRAVTGFSSQLAIMVEAPDVTSDAVVAWMDRFQRTEVQRHGKDILEADSAASVAGSIVGITPTGEDVRTLLAVASKDIRGSLLTDDHGAAVIQFALGDMSLSHRGELTDAIQRDLRGSLAPPAGVTVTPSGLAVVGTELVKGMEANRQSLTLASLGLVALWLLLHGRLRPRSLLPVVPVALAVGVASFIIWALGFELTPLTTVAGPLVIAVATEFTVLLEARYREERARGRTPDQASASLPRIGRAFVASGLTLAGGFAAMALSPMPLLRDFGIVVAIDVAIALVSALVIMPPLLRWTDHVATPTVTPRRDDVVPQPRPRQRSEQLVAHR